MIAITFLNNQPILIVNEGNKKSMKETKNQGNTFLRENKRKNVQNFDFYGIKTRIHCSVSFQNIQMVVFYFFIKHSVLYSSF